MAKKFQISDDDGTSWATFPGSQASVGTELGQIDDTVFGHDYSSIQPGLKNCQFSSNGFYKGFAGYIAKVMKSGTPTAMTAEATTQIGSTKTYQITDATKRALSIAHAVVVDDGGTPVAAGDIASIDYLFGKVTFDAGYTPTGAVTFDAYYLPLTQIARGNSFSLTQTAAAVDVTAYEDAQANDGTQVFDYGLKTVSLEIGGFYSISNAYKALLEARSTLIIEINPDGAGKSSARGFFKPAGTDQSGNVGEPETESISFSLFVPDIEGMAHPFAWNHTSDTTLSLALRRALQAYQAKEKYLYRYLPNGVAGIECEGVITDISLSNALDAMNDFTLSVQGSDELTVVS
jgi:hypothetical protein